MKLFITTILFAYSSLSMAKTTLTTVGDVGQILTPALGLGTTLYLKDYAGTKQWAYSQGTTFLATQALKYGTNKVKIGSTRLGRRPNGGNHNFPSGHTSSVCAGAYFIGKRYGWEYGAAPMGLAFVTGYSRVKADYHTTAAVVAGCALGIVANEIFVEKYNAPTSVTPYLGANGAGVSASVRW